MLAVRRVTAVSRLFTSQFDRGILHPSNYHCRVAPFAVQIVSSASSSLHWRCYWLPSSSSSPPISMDDSVKAEPLPETGESTTTTPKRKQSSSSSSDDNNNNTTDPPSTQRGDDDSNQRKKNKRKKVTQPNKWQEHQAAKKKNGPHTGSFAHPAMQQLLTDSELQWLTSAQDARTKDDDDEVTVKRAKKKLAFLLGYLGTNFAGFQMNPGLITLQAVFELALFRCHMLDERNFGFPPKYGWSTSGRTDKGVHACAQVVSAKIELRPNQSMEAVRDELNAVLPDHVRVLDVLRTTRSFCAKTQRDRVRYQYMFPSFLLADVSFVQSVFENMGAPTSGRNPADPLSAEEIARIRPEFQSYRATPEQLGRLKEALTAYEGTNAYHNFSKGVKPDEARAVRFVVSFAVEDPIVFENGVEWIPTQVLGQSFLLHQIRKMICMAIEVGRGVTTLETIHRAFVKDNAIRVGIAPAQGLYLDMSYYGGYNERKRQQNPELEDIDWTNQDSPVFKRWKDFRNGSVMKHVVSEEEKEGNFIKFLFLQEYIFERDNAYDPDKRTVSINSTTELAAGETIDDGEESE